MFWQTPRIRKQARPNVSTPTARAAGIADLQIAVDTREQYAYRFPTQQVTTTQTGAALRRLRARSSTGNSSPQWSASR